MDNMLQMQILNVDTRNLYVPTGINRLVIDAKRHISFAQQFGETPLLPVHVIKETWLIRYVLSANTGTIKQICLYSAQGEYKYLVCELEP